ncbi:MAG: divalent-cation tolerance protein CutA [Synechococcus sp.]
MEPIPAEPVILVLTTEADDAKAEALAKALVERGLAACVSRGPVRSTYRWQGQLACAQEVQLLIKTTRAGWPALHQGLQALHSYDTPEILHWEAQASAAYGAWVMQSIPQAPPELS